MFGFTILVLVPIVALIGQGLSLKFKDNLSFHRRGGPKLGQLWHVLGNLADVQTCWHVLPNIGLRN